MTSSPLALTLGDPAGIGPEITIKAWQALRGSGPPFLVVGDHDVLAASSREGGAILKRVTAPGEAFGVFPHALPVLDLPLRTTVVAGQPSALAAPSIVQWIETAVGLALGGDVAGVVTAPIAKSPLYEAGFKFPGHTEFLGELTAGAAFVGARGPVMMLTAQDLRVTLATVHTPLARAPALLSREAIIHAGLVTAEALRRDFGVSEPRLAVAASIPTPVNLEALGARSWISSPPPSRPSGFTASTPEAHSPRTRCSPQRRAPATTQPFACITTRR